MVTPFLRLSASFPQIGAIPVEWAPELLAGMSEQRCLGYSLLPQVMSPEADFVIKTGQEILKFSETLDLNCGCPASRVVGHRAGSSLLIDPDYFRSFLEKVIEGLGPGRLSVKLRVGFESSENYPLLISALQGLKLSRVTVHGRTRAQGYRGYADWHLISAMAQKLDLPVFGSGDITDLGTLKARIDQAPKLAGVIIGRGALRNPWIFSQLNPKSGFVQSGVSSSLILVMIETFAILHEQSLRDFHLLAISAQEGLFARDLHMDLEAWLALNRELRLRFGGLEIDEFSKQTLGRCKLLWHYWRSSLVDSMDRVALRSGDFRSFAAAISESLEGIEGKFVPRWQQSWDVVYSGEKTRQSAAASGNGD